MKSMSNKGIATSPQKSQSGKFNGDPNKMVWQMEYVESHRLEKGHTFQLKETLQIRIAEEANLRLIKVKTIWSNSMNLIVAGRNFYVSATYSVQYGWQVTNACCRFGDDFSIIPQKHMVMEDKGLQPPFKSKWVGNVLWNAVVDTPGLTYQMMRKILKPYINEYVLTNNVLQEAHDTAKGDLFGDPDKNVKYAYAIANAIQQMGHSVEVVFTNRHTTMKTVNAIVLKEEMDRKKATKLDMSRDEKVEYVNNWKKDNDTFLCDAFGFENGPQFKFLMGIFISPSTSKEQFPFLQEVLQANAAHMSFAKYTLYSVYGINANGTMSALGFVLLFGNEDKQSWTQFWNFIKKTHPTINQSKYTIITDQDKGSLSAMEEVVPLVGRFLCSFHP
jgi:hypothetical protein